MRDEEKMRTLCDLVRQTAFDLHVYLKHGHLEKVYENGLSHRLERAGLNIRQQAPVKVHDEDGFVLGDYYVDILVEDCLVVELKAAKALLNEHTAQTLAYLRATRIRDAMLINFGAAKIEIKKLIL